MSGNESYFEGREKMKNKLAAVACAINYVNDHSVNY